MLLSTTDSPVRTAPQPGLPAGVEIRHACREDIEPIARLLVEWFKNTSIPFWRVMLDSPYLAAADKPHYGTVLCVDGSIHGFSGVMFADRLMDGRIERFGSLFGWYVRPAFRRHGLALITEQLKMPGVTWTNLTSRDELIPIFLRLGFRRADERRFVIYAHPRLLAAFRTRTVRVVPQEEVTETLLGREAHRIYLDHIGRTVQRIVFESGGVRCLVVTKRVYFPSSRTAKGVLGTEIYYASDRSFLRRHFDAIQVRLFMRDKVAAILAEARILGFEPGRARVLPAKSLFKSATLAAAQIDPLYSELTILP